MNKPTFKFELNEDQAEELHFLLRKALREQWFSPELDGLLASLKDYRFPPKS